MNVDTLRAFIKLAENDCDFGIHKELGIPRSSLWTLIDDLERQTGLQLVLRKKRHNTFTEEAERFLPFALQIVTLFERGLEEANSGHAGEPAGEVLISTTSAIASTFLMPSIKTFRKLYPHLNLRIVADDYISSSTEWMADILLRPIERKDHLDYKWHLTYQHALFASASYLAQNGVPERSEDLVKHTVIGYGERPFSYFPDIDWHLKGRWSDLPRLTPSMTINSTASIYIAASQGMGICSATQVSNLFYEGALIPVLPHIKGPMVRSYFCTKRKMGAKLRRNVDVFRKFFEEYLRKLNVEIHYDENTDTEEPLPYKKICAG